MRTMLSDSGIDEQPCYYPKVSDAVEWPFLRDRKEVEACV